MRGLFAGRDLRADRSRTVPLRMRYNARFRPTAPSVLPSEQFLSSQPIAFDPSLSGTTRPRSASVAAPSAPLESVTPISYPGGSNTTSDRQRPGQTRSAASVPDWDAFMGEPPSR